MQKTTWLLPEGIDELLPEQAAGLEQLRRQLLDLHLTWGYELVITPFVEYLDALLTGTAQDLDLQTFKITDQVSGRLLGIRADITPQAARIDAHQLRRDTPTRLSYIGTVLRARMDDFGGSRSPLQIGAELYGHAGRDSDLEILCLMLETLQAAGVTDLYLDLGHVGIFRGLARAAALSAEQEGQLFDALQRKAQPEIDALLAGFGVTGALLDMLSALAGLNGDLTVLEAAREVLAAAPADVLAALDEVAELAAALQRCRPGVPVHLDLAELRGYSFHSGVTFAAFVPGFGQEIARGGRYDHVGEVFGRARPATGFSADLKHLLRFGTAAPAPVRRRVFAPAGDAPGLSEEIARLRADGAVVIRELPGQQGDAAAMGCNQRLQQGPQGWQLIEL